MNQWEQVYTSDLSVIGKDDVDFQAAIKNSFEPDELRARTANMAYFRAGGPKDITDDQMETTWPTLRQGIAKAHGYDQPVDTDVQLFSVIGQHYQKERAKTQERQKFAMQLHDAAAAGSDMPVSPDGGILSTSADMLHQWQEMQKSAKRMKPLVEELAGYGEAATPEERVAKGFRLSAGMTGDLAEQLAGYSPLDRAMFFKMAQKLVPADTTGGQPTVGKKLERGLIRSVSDILTASGVSELQRRSTELAKEGDFYVNADGEVASKEQAMVRSGLLYERSWKPATPEQVGAARSQVKMQTDAATLRAQIEQVFNQNVDPATLDNWVLDALAEAPAQAGYLAMGMIPVAGPLLMLESIRGQRTKEFLAQGIPMDQAVGMATTSAFIEAPMDWFSSKLLFGKTPGFLKMAGAKSVPLRVAANVGENLALQFGQEVAQDATPLVIQSVFNRLGVSEVPEVTAEQMKAYAQNLPATALTLLPLSLIGGGVASFREMDFAKQYLGNEMLLQAAGASPEAAANIARMSVEDPGKASAALMQAMPSFDPNAETAVAARAQVDSLVTADDEAYGAPLATANEPTTTVQRTMEGNVTRRAAIQSVENVLRVLGSQAPIRYGKMGPKGKNAAGYFLTKQNLVRIRQAEDVRTIAHEIGHAFEWIKFGGDMEGSQVLPSAALQELTTLGHNLYGNQIPAAGYVREGLAEFFMLQVSDPQKAEAMAPEFSKWLRQDIAQSPVLAQAMQTAQQNMTLWHRQGGVARVSGSIAKRKGAATRWSEKMVEDHRRFEDNWLDRFAVLREFGEKARRQNIQVPTSEDPYEVITARNMTADDTVRFMSEQGMVDFYHNRTGAKPLTDALKLVEGKTDEFMVYLYARRALRLWDDPAGGRDPGISREDAAEVVKEFDSPAFQEAARIVYAWNSGVLYYAAESSADFAKIVEKIREREKFVGDYIPLMRVFEDVRSASRAMGKGVKGRALVSRLKGSGRTIKNPFESMLAQAADIVGKAHMKHVFDLMLGLTERTADLGHLITKVSPDMMATHPNAREAYDQIAALVKKLGGSLDAGVLDLDNLNGEELTFFAPSMFQKVKDTPIIQFFRNGKLETHEVDERVYDALTTMGQIDADGAFQSFKGFLAATTRMARMGTTTLSAAFTLRNTLRDARTFLQQTSSSLNTAKLLNLYMGSLYDLAIDATRVGDASKWVQTYEALGVSMAQKLRMDSRPLEAAVDRITKDGNVVKRGLKSAWDYYIDILAVPESAARLAEVKAVAKELGWEPGMPMTAEVYTRLAKAAKQVTTDFTAAGKKAREANQYFMFFNAGIQGVRAGIRAAKENPARFALRGLMFTAASVALWLKNKDEEWWQQLDPSSKYRYTYIPIGGELLRVPRAFELDGLFMAMPEALLDTWYRKDPEAAARWAQQFIGSVTPFPNLPPAILEPVQQVANKDLSTGRPIISRGEELKPAEEQFGPYTSIAAQKLGEITGASPKRIDHAIRSFFGPVGGDLTKLIGTVTERDRDWEAADLPVAGTLFQRGGQYAALPQAVDKLYDELDRVRGIKYSEKQQESMEQRMHRLKLEDATRAIVAMRYIQQHLPKREERQAVEDQIIAIAKDAVDPEAQRGQFHAVRLQAEAYKKYLERTK